MSIHINNPSPGGTTSGSTGGVSDHALLSNLDFPSAGHTGDLNLGASNLSATGITAGTLQGVVLSTGGSLSAISTGGVGQFLYHAGNNTYAYASTQASLPSVTTGKVSVSAPMNTDSTRQVLGGALSISMTTSSATSDGYLTSVDWASFNTRLNSITTGTVGVTLPLTTDTTRYVLGGNLGLSLNTANIWATNFSGSNFYGGIHSGNIFQANGVTAGTLQGIIAGTGGSLFSIGSTGGVGKFLYSAGGNTYAWADTAAQAGLGTDVIVPYTGGISDVNLGNYKLSANAITCGTLQGILMGTGGSLKAIGTTGVVGQFLYVSGGNTYSWANTAAGAGLGTDVVVPYAGAISALVLGQNFSASAITCGTLQGILFGTGGTFTSIATGGVSQFLYHAGNNTYAYANTAASLPTVTTGILGVLLPVTTDNTRYVLGGAVQISLNTANIWATNSSATNFYGSTFSGNALKVTTSSSTTSYATTYSGTTVLATTLSGGTCYATTGSFPTLRATTVTCSAFYSTTTSVVYAAANPIMTVAGQVGVDTTTTSGGAFRLYTDAEYCLPVYQSKSFIITSPAGASTYMLWRTPYTYTLKNVYALCSGGTVTGALYRADGNGANCVTATVNAAITGTTTTASNVVAGVVSSGCFLNWITTATGGTPTSFNCTFNYAVSSNA